MKSFQFNLDTYDGYMVIDRYDHSLSLENAISVEALFMLQGDGEDPTIASLPVKKDWVAPYVAWRLGFQGDTRIPEFQLTLLDEEKTVTLHGSHPIPKFEINHCAGTYDGKLIRLYVNGRLESEMEKHGKIIVSSEKVVFGARSCTSLGGLFIGQMYEMRIWGEARSSAMIDFFRDKSFPLPGPETLLGLWHPEPAVNSSQARDLEKSRFSPVEIALASFALRYGASYSDNAEHRLSGIAKEVFCEKIESVIVYKTYDGLVVLYNALPLGSLDQVPQSGDRPAGWLLAYNEEDKTISDVLQIWSDNKIKVAPANTSEEPVCQVPADRKDVVPSAVNSSISDAGIKIPCLEITDCSHASGNSPLAIGRKRITSPLVKLPDGTHARGFSWLFADIWFQRPSWLLAQKDVQDKLIASDILYLNYLEHFSPIKEYGVINIARCNQLKPLGDIIIEFEKLLSKKDIDEVRDILPFFTKPEHWILLSPSAEYVWPEKMLGNSWRVDFLLKYSDGTYTAVEMESPKKRLYKDGKPSDPYAEWTHAEQQVRDYCNYIDRNRDTVEREESLPGIFRPNGLVVIGRRASLTETGKRKLDERNAENERYKTITFDELLDQAKALLNNLKTVTE